VPAMQRPQEAFAFCMCNPPFFGSIEEANQNPATACGGGSRWRQVAPLCLSLHNGVCPC
jgi:23S rRNA (adenine1618-N6)-methyltransferase